MEDDILAPFLNPVRDITANFDINLVKLLEDYLNKIGITHSEAEVVLDSKNFAEAAIVLQQSANIYGRKVDYLWQLVMQVLEKNKLVAKIIAEKKNGNTQPDVYCSPDFCEIDDETLFCKDVNINISNEQFCEIKFLSKYNIQLDVSSSDERNLILYGPKEDMIGKKYDFRVNKYFSSEGMLVDELGLYNELPVHRESGQDLTVCTPTRMEETEPIDGMIFEDTCVEDKHCHILESFHDCCLPDNDSEYSKSRCSKGEKLGTSHRESDKIINIYEEAWKPWPFDKVVVPNKTFVNMVTFKVPPELVKDEEIERKVLDVSMEQRCNTPSILSFLKSKEEKRIAKKVNNRLIDGEYLQLLHEFKNSEPVKNVQNLQKLKADFDEMAKQLGEEFNDMYYFSDDETRDDEEDQAVVDDYFIDENFDLAEEDNPENLINDIKLPILDLLGDQLQTELLIPPIVENDLAYLQYALEMNPLEIELQQGIGSEVKEWHDKLSLQLQSASERCHFDINAYGAKIISSFPDQDVESKQNTLSFGEIVNDEAAKDVPRFFLAALMLANSYNVEISKSSESQLGMDCVNLTLLNPVLNLGSRNTRNSI